MMYQTKSRAALMAFLVVACLAALQLQPPIWGQELAAPARLPQADAQADFDLTRRALEEAHTGLYRYSTKIDLDQAVAAQREKLGRSVTKFEFWRVMAETLALIRCGHTSITPDDDMRTALDGSRLLPLQMMVEDRRLMVLSLIHI